MKISILTPSYNSGTFIQRAIESVLLQDYPDFEHIIMDGGSTDSTVKILSKFPHLKWISEKDKGQSDAMNKAFNMATGDIIVYLNSDDYFLPNAFKTIVKEFQLNENIDAVIGNLFILYDNSLKPQISSIKLNEIIQFWNYNFPLNPVSYFYKKNVQKKIGPFPENNHYSMDYWFILKLYSTFNLLKTDAYLGVFDLHLLTKSKNNTGVDSLYLETKKFLIERKSTKMKIGFYLSFYISHIKKIYPISKKIIKKMVKEKSSK